nr:MAG TPA: hypothetical protein [Bacteriophage sp.]
MTNIELHLLSISNLSLFIIVVGYLSDLNLLLLTSII